MTDLYDEIAGVKRQLDEAKAKLEPLKAEYDYLMGRVIEDLTSHNKKHEDRTDYRVAIIEKKTWNYPLEIQEAEREVKESKAAYQENHPQSYSVNPGLRVTIRESKEEVLPTKGKIH